MLTTRELTAALWAPHSHSAPTDPFAKKVQPVTLMCLFESGSAAIIDLVNDWSPLQSRLADSNVSAAAVLLRVSRSRVYRLLRGTSAQELLDRYGSEPTEASSGSATGDDAP
jgi:hypothetical protein